MKTERARARTAVAGIEPSRVVQCGSCTLHLVRLCYERQLLFRVFREPLLAGMKVLSWWHGIDLDTFEVRTDACRGCPRFRKNALKEVSPTFRKLNDVVNPFFNRWRDSLVTPEERARARDLPGERGLAIRIVNET